MAIALTSCAKRSADVSSPTRSRDMTLIATRLFNGGSCSASYTSPNVPEPIHLITRQSPSSAPFSKYLQMWQVTCSSTATAIAPVEARSEATLELSGDEITGSLFSRAFLGCRQYIISHHKYGLQ